MTNKVLIKEKKAEVEISPYGIGPGTAPSSGLIRCLGGASQSNNKQGSAGAICPRPERKRSQLSPLSKSSPRGLL